MGFKLPNVEQTVTMVDRFSKPFRKVNQQIERANAPVKRLRASLASMGKELRLDQLSARFGAMKTQFSNIGQSFKKSMTRAIGVTTAFAGSLFLVSNAAAEAGDNIAKTAFRLGLGTDALQELRFAADRAGVSSQTFDMSMQRFGRRAAEAAAGTGEAKDALKALGLDLKDSKGNLKSVEVLFGEVADSMSKIKNPADRNRVAMKLFDSEGVAMVQMLEGGKKGLDEMRMQARKLGGVLGGKALKDSVAFKDSQVDMMFAFKGLTNQIGARLMPAITQLMDRFSALIQKNRPQIEAFVEKFAAALPGAIEKAISIVGRLWNAMQPLITVMKKVVDMVGLENVVMIALAAFIGGPFVGALLLAIPSVVMFGKSLYDTFKILRGGMKLMKSSRGFRVLAVKAGRMGKVLKGVGSTIFKFVARAIPALISSIGAAAKAVWSFGVALMSTPLGWILAAIAAIAVAAYLIYDNWEPIKKFFSDLWLGITYAFKIFVDWIKSKMPAVVAFIVGIWEPIKQYFKNLWSDVLSGFSNAIKQITKMWDEIRNSAAVRFFMGDKKVEIDNAGNAPGAPDVGLGGFDPSLVGNAALQTQNARVQVAFANMPQGARVSAPEGDADIEIEQGFAFGGGAF